MEHHREDLTTDQQAVDRDPEDAEHTLLGDPGDVEGGPEERADEQLRREQREGDR